jgi:hypothetical protein
MDSKQQIKYNKDLLNEIIERDSGILVGEYKSLNVESTIYFKCKCGSSGSKKFRALYNKGGMRCVKCAKENGRKKAENKCLELYGVKNIFASTEMKEKIQKKYQSKTDEEKKLMITKRVETTKLKTDEEKNKSIEKRIHTYNTKTKEEKEEIIQKRKLTFIIKTDDEKKLIKDKAKETNLEKYGVECVFKNIEIQKKIKATNLEKYGVENVFQNNVIKDKAKETNLKKYGTEYAAQSVSKDEWKKRTDKRKETWKELYGYENPAQVPEIFEKIQETAKRFKNYTMPSGEVRKIQGYEGFALTELLTQYTEDQIKTDRKLIGRIAYEMAGSTKYYYPDILISHLNLLIEVKSKFTYTIEPDKIKLKGDACKNQGYNYEIWIYDGKGGKEVVKF